MGVINYEFRSKVLGCATRIVVTIPDAARVVKSADLDVLYPEGIKFPTIYFCHGGGGCASDWVRNSQVELWGNEKGFMTVCIDAMESFFSDMKSGRDYFTYYTEEVMRIVQRYFPSSPAREDNFVAGFSMGGHGAMKLALRCPERFCACMAMSGAKDQVKMGKLALELGLGNGNDKNVVQAFGSLDEIPGTENDLVYLAKALKESGKEAPMLYMSCGTEDYGFALAKEYADYVASVGLKSQFFAVPGIHDYFYANRMLDKAVHELFNIRDVYAGIRK